MDCGGPDVLVTANFVERALRASGCFCGRMPPKWGPCGAARVRRKVRRMARTMRASSLHAHGCAFNEPRSTLAHLEGMDAGRRATGVCFFRLPFFAQAKKGDSLAQRASESFSSKNKKQDREQRTRLLAASAARPSGHRRAMFAPASCLRSPGSACGGPGMTSRQKRRSSEKE